jgi:hypothetical protein
LLFFIASAVSSVADWRRCIRSGVAYSALGNHVEVLKESSVEPTSSLHFLKFDQPVPGLEKQRVAIAFALDLLPNVQRFDPKIPLAKQLSGFN